MERSTSLRRILLATTSIAALVAGGSRPASAAPLLCVGRSAVLITGASSGFTNPAGAVIGCILATEATVTGNIVNAGTVSPGEPFGIGVINGTFNGSIVNTGTITAQTGILVTGAAGATFSGTIVNTGNITDTVGSPGAINVAGAPNAMTIDQMGGTLTGSILLSTHGDTLNISGGAINGNIVGPMSPAGTVNFALGSGTFTYGSAFSISNVSQINVNSGRVILDGTNSAGSVAVNGGTLVVGDASNPGAMLTATGGFVTVGPGGTLAGHGTVVGSIAVPAGATLAPGGSIGTLNVSGSLSLAAGSFYGAEVAGSGASSTTNATGTATISGGTVKVTEDPGNYALSTRYTILTATGGVTGTFAGADSGTTLFTPVLSYDADDVLLTLIRNPHYFAGLAQTPNQLAVGGALDQSPFGSAVVQAAAFVGAAGGRQALDALSGEVHASVQSVLMDDAHYMRQAVLGRLRQAAYAGSPGAMGALGFTGPGMVAAPGGSAMPGEGLAAGLGLALADPPVLPVKAPLVKAPPASSDLTFWAQAVGAWGQLEGDGNAAGVRRDLGGFFSGVDGRFGEFARVGLAGGYTRSSVDDDARASSAGIDTAHLAAYAGANFGAFNLRGGGAYAFHTIDTSRAIIFPGFFDSARARYDGGTGQIFGEVGYGVALGEVAAEPFAGLSWVHLQTDGFSETGGVSALDGSGSHDDVGYATLGARAATSYLLANGWALIPRASAAWQHAFGDTTPTAALAFQATGIGFSVAGVPLAQDAALVEAGLDLRISPQAKFCLSYSGELAARLQDHAVKANFTWSF